MGVVNVALINVALTSVPLSNTMQACTQAKKSMQSEIVQNAKAR